MKLILTILFFTFIPFVGFLQKMGVLVLSGDVDYFGYDKSEFVIYYNDEELGKFSPDGFFNYSSEQKGPLTIKHPDFLPFTVENLSFSKKNYSKSIYIKISPETEKKLFEQFKNEQLNTCTGSDKAELINDSPPVAAIDSIASFPGGNDGLNKFLSSTLKYPEPALELGIQGKVYISFIVEADGSITCIEIKRGADYLLDREAFRCMKSLPQFQPAMDNGVAIPTIYLLPISFNLQ